MVFFLLVYTPVVFGQPVTEGENLNNHPMIGQPTDAADEVVLRLTLFRKFILANQVLFASNELKKISALLYAYEPEEIRENVDTIKREIEIDGKRPIRILQSDQDSYKVIKEFDSIDTFEKYIHELNASEMQNQLIGLEDRLTSSGTDLKSVDSYIIRSREYQQEPGEVPG